MPDGNLDTLCVNTLRLLAADAVQQAGNGHPGGPMGQAAMAYTLWDRFLKHNPTDPSWHDRDRFVLSAGHASMLLYGLLHLTGYDLPLDEIKRLRQWGSITPGHPERGLTPGVEVTTGPLGQGFAHAVGLAIGEQWLASHYNRPGHTVVDHHTYVVVSDGDLMEGVSAEAASLAGHLGLGKLIVMYDDNDISIEGPTDLAFTEDVPARFRAYGWHVVEVDEGMEPDPVHTGLREALAVTDRPSMVVCRTVIGYGSPNKSGTAAAHGAALGAEEVTLTKEALGWTYEEPFATPAEAVDHYRQAVPRGQEAQRQWQERFSSYREAYPELAAELEGAWDGVLPEGWSNAADALFNPGDKPISTREASGRTLNALVEHVHGLVGGSADLAPSNNTRQREGGDFSASERTANNLHFGVREHAMGGVANGMAIHGGLVPYTGTFLTFSDYMRPPMRLAALMGIRVVYVFTHDSNWPWRGRPHAPAHRAPGRPSRRAQPDGGATRRRHGDRGGVEVRHRAQGRPHPPGLQPAEPPGARPIRACARVGDAPRRLRLVGERSVARRHPHRHRLRGACGAGRRKAAAGAGRGGPCGVAALVGDVRRAAEGLPRQRPAAECHGTGHR